MPDQESSKELYDDGAICTPGVARLSGVLAEVERKGAEGDVRWAQPLATGFSPLDDVLNGGLHAGEMMVVGGSYGVGKTMLALQIARNVACRSTTSGALYVSYQHDRIHLMSRLLCLESAELYGRDAALTWRKLADLAMGARQQGLPTRLRSDTRYRELLDVVAPYADRLHLAQASGETSSVEQILTWVTALRDEGVRDSLLVVDYAQKVPVGREVLPLDGGAVTYVARALKELALALGLRVIVVSAADGAGLRTRRMRLRDLQGGSALQYEADIGIMLNIKYDIVSREQILSNPAQALSLRNWLVLTVEKNRSGPCGLDMEYGLDTPHFRIAPLGDFVRDRLVDGVVVTD